MKEAKKLKDAIGAYCRAKVNAGHCHDGDCEFCPVNDTYMMAEKDADEKEDDSE